MAGFRRRSGDCPGTALNTVTAPLTQCARDCLADINCEVFTYNTLTQVCNTKDTTCNVATAAISTYTYNKSTDAFLSFTMLNHVVLSIYIQKVFHKNRMKWVCTRSYLIILDLTNNLIHIKTIIHRIILKYIIR